MDDARIFPDEFVPNAEGASYHSKWLAANKNGDALKWAAFRDMAKAYKKGDSLSVPVMATKYGRALVAAGKLHMSVIDIGADWTPVEPPPGEEEYGTYNNPWGATSPWRTSAVGRAAHPNSSLFISNLYNGVGSGININQQYFTVSVWSNTYHPFATAQWSTTSDGGWYLDNVYYPTDYVDDFAPARERHAVFYDLANKRVASFYNSTTSRTYRTGVFHKLDGSGWWNNASEGIWGARASGAATSGGLLTRYDIFTAPSVQHALCCCIPTTLSRQNTVVSPATTSDGTGTDAADLPMGACIVLSSSVDVDNDLNYASYSAAHKKMLKAIQRYGLYVVDSSSSMAIYAQNWQYGDQSGSSSGYPTSPISKEWLLDSYVAVPFPGTFTYDTKALFGGQPHQ